jgi:hypothetical protein
MIHREGRPDLSDFLVGLLRTDHIVYAEHYTEEISHAFPLDAHSGPEASVQRRSDPCSTEVRSRIEVRERLGALEAKKFAEVAGNVEVDEGDEDCLPDGDLLGEEGGDAAEDRWAMTVASEIVSVSRYA